MTKRIDEVTKILNSVERGEAQASDQLLPLVYQELRCLAAQRLKHEPAGHTLQATALVHEAYLRLVDSQHRERWDSRGHFFAAAAEAMRRVVIDNARRKLSSKRGGGWFRRSVEANEIEAPNPDVDLLALDEALRRLEAEDHQAAKLVELRYFSGLTVPQAAEVLDVSTRSAERIWTFAKAWLFRELSC